MTHWPASQARASFLGLAATACTTSTTSAVMVQSWQQGLSWRTFRQPDVKLSIDHEPSLAGEPVLVVEYPEPTEDPAGRDVWCDAENTDWTSGQAIAFRVRPSTSLRLSVSFVDRLGVAYTTWIELQGGLWQPVRVPFDSIQPNPYFQRPALDCTRRW
jgi:hypothetical protein